MSCFPRFVLFTISSAICFGCVIFVIIFTCELVNVMLFEIAVIGGAAFVYTKYQEQINQVVEVFVKRKTEKNKLRL